MAPSADASDSNQARLARYIAGHRQSNFPDHVLDQARLCLADWLAVAIGARDEPAGRIVRETVAGWKSTGGSRVIFGGTAAAPFAALANGTLAHCLDFDDTHVPSVTHTSAPVWAATLALGEATGASELDMLRAFVVGFEVAARAGNGLGQAITGRGFHSTGVWGRLGAAAASAALLELDETRTRNALGVAATQSSGLAASFGTMAKPFHAGKAAMDGILAAELAAKGFTGAAGLLDPGGGLDNALVQDRSLAITPATFERWEILENSFKPYAACHLVHPAADAARALAVSPERIARIRAFVAPLAMQITGSASGRPETPLAAKFDLKYCIALALHGRRLGADDFLEPWSPDPAVLATAAKIEPAADAETGFASARLDVDMLDGATRSSIIATAKGHPANPIGWDDMAAKLDGLARGMLGAGAAALLGHVRGFGSGGSLAGIARVLDGLAAGGTEKPLREIDARS